MSFALSAAVSGLQAHQKMLDIAGNNLANVNTTAFKASRITFSELLSETIKKASQPTSNLGGTNPQQMGSGVGVGGITPNMSQGNLVNTGQPLDLAIEGEGYFVLSDGQQNVFTRNGAFGVDDASMLVDPATGYRVQRIGAVGEAEGFQTAADSNINVPYDASVPARATTEITVSGNLSADEQLESPDYHTISSNVSYTIGAVAAELTTEMDQLDQFSGGGEADGQLSVGESGTVTISGFQPDGTAITDNFAVDSTTTVGDLIDYLNNTVLSGATASLDEGRIKITDDSLGYSRSDISLSYAGDGQLTAPAYFEVTAMGGDQIKTASITAYDSLGGKHVLSTAFVRSDTPNVWDMVLTSITGDINELTIDNRRIEGISFDPSDGSYAGLTGTDPTQFVVTFAHDSSNPQTIDVQLGTPGTLDGLVQLSGPSTAYISDQDGCQAGQLTSLSVNNEGILVGAFTNGEKMNIAQLQVGLFQNPSALEGIGNGYVISSANSGEAIATQAQSGGSGTIHGGSLEKSNADVATEFVNLIEAQNGFQANARTVRIANEVLRELTNLIR